jgi:hypothetical protein
MANPSDAQLRRWYLTLNAELWAGSLPADTILTWQPVRGDHMAETWKLPDGRWQIAMSPGNSGFGRVAKFILMHEMCHVAKSRAWRGKVFKTEAIRIMAAGGINDF